MHRAALICAALAFGIFAFPLAAQQTTPDQTLPPAQETAPEVPPAPLEPQTAPEAPPPFAPMPQARPTHRWVDVNGRRASHAHRSARHAHHHATRPSRRTERWCRRLNHGQMLRHSACRALIPNPHHVKKHRHHHIHHHRVHHHHKAVHRHRTAHRR